ncbi:hypothetical protein [Thalassomonas sp. RHCl1]|uniref:hypothetical protein n=1 Tax=Thalassomonas sp. RHCl1 TaxID=2995320 RepID=UPI00248D1F5E|nr:hypothetical protein [Thalassomonas sp. RHCl1]
MKNDWNKYIYPETFLGFIDASSHQNNGAELNALTESRVTTLADLSQQAKFDGKLIDARLLQGLSHNDHVWGKICYQQLRQYFNKGQPIGHHQIYVLINPEEMSDSAAINRCAELLEHFIGTGEVSIRLLLKNTFELCHSQLLKIVRMCELSGVQRICFADDHSQFSPAGVKRFLAALNATSHANALTFECAFAGGGEHAKENAITAITSGINYIHVTASYLAQSDQAQPVIQLMQEFSSHNFALNKEALQQYILVYHQQGLENPLAITSGLAPVTCEQVTQTAANSGNAKELAAAELTDKIALRFDVSANDWHVSIQLLAKGQAQDLGERVHHYVMLLLAREYYQQYQQMMARDGVVDPLLVGWVEREALHQMIGDNEAQFNVKLCRARKHIVTAAETLGVMDYQPLSTRQGAVRLNCGNVTVVQGSKVEFEMENWHFAEEYPQLKQA